MELFFKAAIIGLGLTFGVLGAIGFLKVSGQCFDWCVAKVYPNLAIAKWQYNTVHKPYSEVQVNSVPYVVMPANVPDLSLLRSKNTKDDHYLAISVLNSTDIMEKELMGATKQTVTGA